MSERGWGQVWHGHSLPVGTAPPVPSARRAGEEEEEGDGEDVAAAAPAPPAPRCAARLRARRSSGPAGQGLPAEGSVRGARGSCPAETSPRAAVPGVPRQPALPYPVPRASGERCGRDVAPRVFPQPLLSSDRALSAPIATW